jgi:serine/threonine protein kinase
LTLSTLADKKVYHRDVKPDNIAFRAPDSWTPVLIDFGIARADDSTTLTATGRAWGTPLYSPPEWRTKIKGEVAAQRGSRAWDAYSFARVAAVTLAVAVGRELSDVEWLSNAELLRTLGAKLPQTVYQLRQGLRKRPSKRTDECYDLALDIDIGVGSDLTSRVVGEKSDLIRGWLAKALKSRLTLRTGHRWGGNWLAIKPASRPKAWQLCLGTNDILGTPSVLTTGKTLRREGRWPMALMTQLAQWERKFGGEVMIGGRRPRRPQSVKNRARQLYRQDGVIGSKDIRIEVIRIDDVVRYCDALLRNELAALDGTAALLGLLDDRQLP